MAIMVAFDSRKLTEKAVHLDLVSAVYASKDFYDGLKYIYWLKVFCKEIVYPTSTQ